MSETSPYSLNNVHESPNEIRPLEPEFAQLQVPTKPEKLFNYRGIERFKESLPVKTEEEEDPIEMRITVERLKQKLVELNDHSAERAGISQY